PCGCVWSSTPGCGRDPCGDRLGAVTLVVRGINNTALTAQRRSFNREDTACATSSELQLPAALRPWVLAVQPMPRTKSRSAFSRLWKDHTQLLAKTGNAASISR